MKDLITERLKLKDIYPERAKELAEESGIDIEDLELIRKGIVAEKIETVEHERAVISFINMETVDRDNEIIDPDGAVLKYYNKVVPYGHNYGGLPMGKSMWIKKATKRGKRGLLAKTVFLKRPPINEELYHMFTDDVAGTGPVLNSWSIGFIPLKWEELEQKGEPKEGRASTQPRRKYTKWELLEYSGVMIPSNRQALTEMVEKGLIKSEKLKKEIEKYIEIEDKKDDKAVCPDCGEATMESKEGGYQTCTACEWVEENVDKTDNSADSFGFLKAKGEGIYTLEDGEEIEMGEKGVITKPEETDELIRLPAKGEEGKHKEHKIRWITVSAEKGIRGIYCIDCKKIITYVFEKAKGWTMAKAKAWMKDNEKQVEATIGICVKADTDFEGMQELLDRDEENRKIADVLNDKDILELEEKSVIPFKDTGIASEGAPWNGPKEVRDAEVSDLKVMCCWYDSENADIKGAYKLPHHQASGHKAVWRGTAAAMAALLGARGGVNVPSGDRRGIYNHLVKTYKLFDKEPPEFKEYSELEFRDFGNWEIQGNWNDTLEALKEDKPTEREQQIMRELFDRLTEQFNRVEEELKSLKEGRVLSAKNRKLIQDALVGMEAAIPPLNTLLTATEPPNREAFELDIDKVDNGGKDVKDNPDTVDIDPDKLAGIIQEVLKNNIDKIGEEIEKRISKMKGKVE